MWVFLIALSAVTDSLRKLRAARFIPKPLGTGAHLDAIFDTSFLPIELNQQISINTILNTTDDPLDGGMCGVSI